MSKSKKNRKDSSNRKQPKKAAAISQPSFFTNSRLHIGLIMAFSFLLYANTIPHGYTQDDAIVIYDNMYTTDGISGIAGLLKYDTFKGFFKTEGKDKLVSGGRYRPLTPILFAIEWQLFSKPKKDDNGQIMKDQQGDVIYEGRPWIGHLFNIIFYGLTGVVLYLLLLRLLNPEKNQVLAFGVALGTALLFIAHPIHTEAVANIKGRDEIITMLGSLAAALFSLRAYQEKNSMLNIWAGLIFFLALMSKENAITFLAVIPLMYFVFTKASISKIISQTIPFLIAAIVFIVIRFSVLDWSFGGESAALMNNPFLKLEGNKYVPFSTDERLATIIYTLGKYIQLLFFPHPLTHDYYPRHIEMMTFGNWKVLLSLVAYIGLIGLAIKGALQKDRLGFAIAFFIITLSIVSNLFFPIGTNMAERLLFMPSAGFCLAVVLLLYRLAKKNSNTEQLSNFGQLKTSAIILGVFILLLSFKTVDRNRAWKDNFTLFSTDIKTSVNSAKLRNAMGGELTTQSGNEDNEAKRVEMLNEAVVHLKEALRIHPGYKDPYLILGNVHNYLKKYDEAIAYYRKVLAINPDDKNAFNNMGITYRDAGRYYGEQKQDIAKALQYLGEAEKLMPEDFETLRLQGVAYGMSGNNPKAIQYFEKAVKVRPDDADSWWNLGSAYFHAGNAAKADEYHKKAASIDPDIVNRRSK